MSSETGNQRQHLGVLKGIGDSRTCGKS